MHCITAKLNRDAKMFPKDGGAVFFVSLGEKNYDYKAKSSVWTNYDAAIYAKESQIDYYTKLLVKGSVVAVYGSGLIPVSHEEYGTKLSIQNAQLGPSFGVEEPSKEPAKNDFIEDEIPF